MRISDWSSDVCSADLADRELQAALVLVAAEALRQAEVDGRPGRNARGDGRNLVEVAADIIDDGGRREAILRPDGSSANAPFAQVGEGSHDINRGSSRGEVPVHPEYLDSTQPDSHLATPIHTPVAVIHGDPSNHP